MAELFLGKPVADGILQKAQDAVCLLPYRPKLAVVRVGARDDDLAYERSLQKRCQSAAIDFQSVCLQQGVTTQQICDCINQLNADDSVHGILLFQPLSSEYAADAVRIRNTIAAHKDVDCVTDASLSGVFLNKRHAFAPCTAEACMEVLRYYRVPIMGAEAVVVGRSFVIGRPLANMLLGENATVTVCHTKTRDLETVCKRADILIAAAGSPRLIGKQHVRPGQIVLDVGVHCLDSGEMCGDVDSDAVLPVVQALTPVPRGIGAVTTAVLLAHVCRAALTMEIKA